MGSGLEISEKTNLRKEELQIGGSDEAKEICLFAQTRGRRTVDD